MKCIKCRSRFTLLLFFLSFCAVFLYKEVKWRGIQLALATTKTTTKSIIKHNGYDIHIVATVDDIAITNRDVINRENLIKFMGGSPQNDKTLRTMAIYNLIDDVVLKKEAARIGLKLTQSDVEDGMLFFIKKFSSTPADFMKKSKADGVNIDDLKVFVKSEIIKEIILHRYLKNSINITDVDIEDHAFLKPIIKQHQVSNMLMSEAKKLGKKRFTQHTLVDLAEIVLPANIEQKNLQQVITILKSAENFSKLAKQISLNKVTASNGGRIGWIMVKDLSPEYINAIEKLPEGTITNPIKIGNVIAILKVLKFKKLSDNARVENNYSHSNMPNNDANVDVNDVTNVNVSDVNNDVFDDNDSDSKIGTKAAKNDKLKNSTSGISDDEKSDIEKMEYGKAEIEKVYESKSQSKESQITVNKDAIHDAIHNLLFGKEMQQCFLDYCARARERYMIKISD